VPGNFSDGVTQRHGQDNPGSLDGDTNLGREFLSAWSARSVVSARIIWSCSMPKTANRTIRR